MDALNTLELPTPRSEGRLGHLAEIDALRISGIGEHIPFPRIAADSDRGGERRECSSGALDGAKNAKENEFFSHKARADLPVATPCEDVLESAEALNRLNGHENAGFLSRSNGFMPLHQPLTCLPECFRAWDVIAANLPCLIKRQTLRSAVNNMPLLSARAEHLPAAYLHRASTLLSVLAHAYIHLDGNTSTILPACIEKPWTEVANRLGHKVPFLSYIDLIVYNYRNIRQATAIEELRVENLRVENLRLLVPTVDNNEERTFYLAQTEILAQATPLLNSIVEAQQAVLTRNTASLVRIFLEMTEQLYRIARVSLMKISASPSHTRQVDPVVWAKTVAPLAVPLRPDVQGPGGIASPLFHMMDTFINRESYNAFLGEEALKLRATYPPHWRAFIGAIGAVSIPAYIKKTCNAALDVAWHALKEAYCGRQGLLGLHRRKVYAFLPVGFKVGRYATNAHLKGNLAEEGWVKVHRELEKSREERYAIDEAAAMTGTATPGQPTIKPERRYTVSELARHCSAVDGYWLAARGRVYNVSTYMRNHPGGDKILVNSTGRDATSDLYAVSHFEVPAIQVKLDRFVIGVLHVPTFSDIAIKGTYDLAVAMVYKAVDLQTTYQNDVTFLDRRFTSAEDHEELTPQKIRSFMGVQERMLEQYIPTLVAHALAVTHAIWTLSFGVCSVDRLIGQLSSIQKPCGHAPQNAPSTWADVRRGIKVASDFLNSVRMNAIELLTSLEAIPEGGTLIQKTLLNAAETALSAITDSLVQVVENQCHEDELV